MEINVDSGDRVVEIWLTRSDAANITLRETLRPKIAQYKKQKYSVAVFESGQDDLLENTKVLIAGNAK